MKKFWILWSPQSNLPPARRWDEKKEAVKVAEIMAEKHPSQEFYVCQTVSHSSVLRAPVRTTVIK